MKKIFIFVLLISIIVLTGCGRENADKVLKELTNKIEKLNGYNIKGEMEVKNNNNSYNYDVEVSYKEKDKFKVSLINKSNNHEQVILRNDDGVFVLTPSLNKSFKFQSDWPYNNSQIYILNSIISDLNNDQEVKKEEIDGKYIFTSKVNYPNNNKLKKQRVTVNSNLFIEKIEVLTEDNEVEMMFKINNTDYNPTFDETYFEVNSIINEKNNDTEEKQNDNTNCNSNDSNCNLEEKKDDNIVKNQSNSIINSTLKRITMDSSGDDKIAKTATIEDIIYPLYLPSGTVLKEQEKVNKTDGERVILTFAGEKGFTLVEETVSKESEFTIIPTYGEPGFVNDTIGAITDNSLNWISNGIEYYMVSDVMNTIELLDVANSINVKAVMNLK